MKAQWKRGHKNDGPKAKGRRKRALVRLEDLTAKRKLLVKSGTPLTDEQIKEANKHIKRGEKEIEILKTRI